MIIVLSLMLQYLNAQVIYQPSIGSKTHASMSIDSIVLDDYATRCYLKVVNKSTEGKSWFCADKEIVLVELNSNSKYRLVNSTGIPTCPEAHQFTYYGEELSFQLVFPPISDRNGELDIMEQCPEHCFSLKGIVLDPVLNREIRLFEDGAVLFQNDKFESALRVFEELKNSRFKRENHYAYTMYILPVIYYRLGDVRLAKQAFVELKSTQLNNKEYFLNKIREIPFFRSLD